MTGIVLDMFDMTGWGGGSNRCSYSKVFVLKNNPGRINAINR